MSGPSSASAELAGELARLCVQVALGAGEVARRGREQSFDVATKSTPTDPVTDVDRAVERWLVEQLLDHRPGDGVLGEEQGERAGTSGVRWVLDPIDGTVNFVLGLPQWAVSVAAEIDGTVVAGCVRNPSAGTTYRAVRGGGAWLDRDGAASVRLHGGRRVDLSRAVIGTGFGYDRATRAEQGALVAALLPRIADIRRLGSASLDICAVAAGHLDGYFESGLHHWDSAAALLIAERAGCQLAGVRTATGWAPPDGRLTVVAGPALGDELADLLSVLSPVRDQEERAADADVFTDAPEVGEDG